jgi:NAD(P)-dependent dehydrogenase (short-subunit alcohol dehydrogenase family)
MKNFEGKVAFVTGAANGIGLGITRAFIAKGMRVMLADIEPETLTAAVDTLRQEGADVAGVVCDVADVEAVRAAAQKTIATFGKIHVLVNNAGVGGGSGETGTIAIEDWQWTVNVNLMGVVYGCETFVPLIKQHGEGGYIVNTASMAGHLGVAGMAPYNATKFAVVGYSESMNAELAPQGIGVAVLCPAWVKTQIADSRRNHPSETKQNSKKLQAPDVIRDKLAEIIENGMSPDTVGKWVVESMERDAFHIITHPHWRPAIEAKAAKLLQAYDEAAQSATILADENALSTPFTFANDAD